MVVKFLRLLEIALYVGAIWIVTILWLSGVEMVRVGGVGSSGDAGGASPLLVCQSYHPGLATFCR